MQLQIQQLEINRNEMDLFKSLQALMPLIMMRNTRFSFYLLQKPSCADNVVEASHNVCGK